MDQPTTKPWGQQKVELARIIFKEFYACCFWHLKPDLVVSEATMPLIIKGLRAHGGRRGLLAVAQLMASESADSPCH